MHMNYESTATDLQTILELKGKSVGMNWQFDGTVYKSDL